MVSTRKGTSFFALIALLLPLSVSAVPQNSTVDDGNQARIKYWTDADWSHDPLQGYEQFFVNGTRSYTYLPGATALFTFTGTGIYLQGPYSNDQAQRSVTLDGQDMGTFTAYAPEQLPSESTSVFWGKGCLENTAHTVAVTHADTADKILVMDAWIFEADLSPSQSTCTSTADAVISTPSSTSTTLQSTDSVSTSTTPQSTDSGSTSTTPQSTGTSGSAIMSTIGIVIGVVVPFILLLLCSVGYCLFSRRLRRNQQRQHSTTREKTFSSRNTMHLSESVYPTSPTSGPSPSNWRSAAGASAHEFSLNKSNAELPTAAVTVPRGGGAALPSHPFYPRPRAASDTHNKGDALSLLNHPLFSPNPWRVPASSDSHNPTSPAPPTKSDFAPQPTVSPPASASVLRRFSATMTGVIPGLLDRASSRNSDIGQGRDSRTSILTNFRHNATAPGVNNNLGSDVERAASPRSRDSDAYAPYASLPYLPSSSNSLSNPLSPTSTTSIGFGRQSANLEKQGDLKYKVSNLSKIDTPATPGGDVEEDGDRGSEAEIYDDEYALSSYTRLKRDGMRWRPVSTVRANNPG